jgi:flagellar protein FlaG
MNEVRMSQLTPQPVTSAASSQGIATTRSLPPQSGNTLPVKEAPAPEQVAKIEKVDTLDKTDKTDQAGRTESIKEAATLPVEIAVTEINDYVQSVQRDLQFFVDEDSGVTVVRVRDKETGDLIRQIPEDIFLNLAQKLKEDNTLNLLNAYG